MKASKGITLFIPKADVQKILDNNMDWHSFYIKFVSKIHEKLSKMTCEWDTECKNLAFKEGYCKDHYREELQIRLRDIGNAKDKLLGEGIPEHMITLGEQILKTKYEKELQKLTRGIRK